MVFCVKNDKDYIVGRRKNIVIFKKNYIFFIFIVKFCFVLVFLCDICFESLICLIKCNEGKLFFFLSFIGY